MKNLCDKQFPLDANLKEGRPWRIY